MCLKNRIIWYFALITALTVHGKHNVTNPRPNIIIFLVDDMGIMDTSVPFFVNTKGEVEKHPLNDWYHTPNMERLAKLGTRFSTFYAQSVCSPSRISILTGQNAARHRTTQWIHPIVNNRGKFGPEDWRWEGIENTHKNLLSQRLKSEGYQTIFVGKGHLGAIGTHAEEPLRLGFDYNIGGNAWGSPGSYLGQDNYAHPKKKNQVPHLESYHGKPVFLTEALTLEANKKISQAVQADIPFFLEMSHYAVHRPFIFDKRFKSKYTSNIYSKEAQKFASMVEGMDTSLGDILNHLETLGIADNTLIFFMGDNGSDAPIGNPHDIASVAPLRGKKGTHYEGGTRIPFMVAWAKPNKNNRWQKRIPIVQGAINQKLGTIMDIYPTVLDMLGLEKPHDYSIDGHSLYLILTGKKDEARPNDFLMHFPHEHRSSYFTSYRKGNWKLIYHYFPEMNPAQERYELYNLSNDHDETKNLYQKEPKILAYMMTTMLEKLEAENALFPIDKNEATLKPFLKK
ncbi:sulfatase-like hydrolase/transferase [Aquimarina algicola]|uniref:DUF4976 domain-containing protein n=1 Tax=Aquimarina algicola TaxID=2589995 RepID=A0A504J0R9_9FLAO|nr:sulfatase-like hydrolase/transferase [Aquimarina algicola]TPN84407.1 DUF4976 domain-containing protein [Aquimarina algicola]